MTVVEFSLMAHRLCLWGYGGAAVLCGVAAVGGRERLGRVGVGVAGLGLLVQVVLLGVRWNAAGYLPVTGLFSTLHFLAIWVVGIALYFAARYRARSFLPAALAFSFLALLGATRGDLRVGPLTPSLDTPLFFLHVATSFAAYGLFGCAALLAVYRRLGIPGSTLGEERRMLDECLYLGYVLFTWCMVAGSLWAYLAWGSYWTWRIKGLWSTILWFFYSGVIHVRNRPNWQGWPVDVLALAGFALVLFTFLGLGLFFETEHGLG